MSLDVLWVRVRDWKFSVLLAMVALGIALGLRESLTALMSLHMLVQIPLLVLAGLFAEQAWHGFHASHALPSDFRPVVGPSGWSWNEYGLPGLLLVSLVGACWMVPKALDDALVDWRVAAFKYLALPVCGWILRGSLRRSNVIVKIFFLGNFCWMSAIVGVEYLNEPIRLCNAYLQDDQAWSGRGLIALAIMLPSCWLLTKLKPIWRFLNR